MNNYIEKTINENKFKYFYIVSMIYLMIMLCSIVVVYKIVQFKEITVAASTLIMPFWFFLCDVIAEIYGYKMIRRLIWLSLLFELIFIILLTMLIHLPSPKTWQYESDYVQVFGGLPRIFLGNVLAVLTGGFVNIIIITKLKIVTRARFFWLRSLTSSTVGEAVYTFVAFTVDFINVVPFSQIMELIIVSYTIKILFSPIASVLGVICTGILRRAEGGAVEETKFINFNPLKI